MPTKRFSYSSTKKFYHHEGISDTAEGWAERLGFSAEYFRQRTRSMPESEWFKPKHRFDVKLTYQGKTQTLMQWCRELGLARATVHARLRKKLPVEEVLYTGHRRRKHGEYTDPEILGTAFDEDLALKRTIEGLRKQGLTDDEIMDRYRSAA